MKLLNRMVGISKTTLVLQSLLSGLRQTGLISDPVLHDSRVASIHENEQIAAILIAVTLLAILTICIVILIIRTMRNRPTPHYTIFHKVRSSCVSFATTSNYCYIMSVLTNEKVPPKLCPFELRTISITTVVNFECRTRLNLFYRSTISEDMGIRLVDDLTQPFCQDVKAGIFNLVAHGEITPIQTYDMSAEESYSNSDKILTIHFRTDLALYALEMLVQCSIDTSGERIPCTGEYGRQNTGIKRDCKTFTHSITRSIGILHLKVVTPRFIFNNAHG
ncbi:hypothetical protein CLF_107281 [Clonorchis sinensis]|uniref:Uncharacterized protein n=1 Tax=Clonorchis sinensis TaxID=79923 RepID=G7YGI0_CLOSI|nr:hypothetical protein CLF_107281 [Clonorchis sinensis]